MATKKPTVKKPAKAAKKPVVKAATKKIAVKPPVKPAATAKKPAKKGVDKSMTKLVVDRITLPKGGKVYVKAAKRPVSKPSVKKAAKKK